MASKMKSLFPS